MVGVAIGWGALCLVRMAVGREDGIGDTVDAGCLPWQLYSLSFVVRTYVVSGPEHAPNGALPESTVRTIIKPCEEKIVGENRRGLRGDIHR